MDETAQNVEADAKLRIKQGPKTGRTYRRKLATGGVETIRRAGRGRAEREEFRRLGFRRGRGANQNTFVLGYGIHRASAPGESPASHTGFLANSIQTTPAVDDGTSIRASVAVGARYGRPLEETLNRPFMRPAVDRERSRFVAAVEAAVQEML